LDRHGADGTEPDGQGRQREHRGAHGYAQGGPMKLTKEAIAEIKALEDRRGRLSPQEIVEAARAEGSALHECFEWDDTKAAESWRIEQARDLIRRVKIEVVIEDRSFRTVAYVRDQDQTAHKAGYRSVLKITKTGSAQMMRAELEAIGADMARAIGLAWAKQGNLPGVAERLEAIKALVDEMASEL